MLAKLVKVTIKRRDVCPSIRMEQFGYRWTDFREI
jgi:hypothetical protein